MTEFSAGISPGANLTGITTGPDGNLWFSELSGDRVGRITPSGAVTEYSAGITNGAGPEGITAGPDGAMWFTERFIDGIGRITTGAGPGPGPEPVEPEPVAGESVVVKKVSGRVLVKLPGSDAFVPLEEVTSIPVGSIVDTRKGKVALTSTKSPTKTQTAKFKDGRFKVTQSRKRGAFTVLKLNGPLLGCPGSKRAPAGAASLPRKKRGGRGLWGSGNGKFTSRGNRGSGSARGTTWQVIDRCNDTTVISSIKGRVVARDLVRNRKIILRTGEGVVIRPRGR